eukprot:CAMPEP_0114586542 /NCGR_PEP_ID=MMETSP0125-20121206/9729_1 /TAXON_ID=485358 ORGANISM="Aristerostoma sp., Strain ATCC 50986" /NCGR_SAMPLE_ID=MMETSP0125 /ASSEMBLY_ACC=CAM_ASM_000245 /LENGTH=78 /DNA_ID=CAMNT_0001782011 /DNA_START=693 /DNA_END=929 /DNA_ORIENTATION=-
MDPWIEMARNYIDHIIDILDNDFSHLDARVAVVGYRDNDNMQYLVKNFTRKLDVIKTFIGSIVCKGGVDVPEDVNGGL